MSSIDIGLSPSSRSPDEIREISLQDYDTSSIQSQLVSTPTKSRQLMANSANSPRFSSYSPSLNSTTQKSKRFDERLRSRFSGLLNTQSTTHSLVDGLHSQPEEHAQPSPSYLESSDITSLKWVNLESLNNTLYSGHSRAVYGDPTCIVPGDIVVVGTTKGFVLIFDYRQTMIHILGKNSKSLTSGSVTSLALSLDSSHVAVGFESGGVFLWNLKNPTKPLAHIQPMISTETVVDGHIKGVAVNSISFVGKRHTVLVSTNIYGLVYVHRCLRGVLGFNVKTEKILGRYEDLDPQSVPRTVFTSASLPLGSSVEPTDSMGLVAIISSHALLVISISTVVRTQFKIGRPKVVNDSLGRSGVLSWFPAVVLKDGRKVPARLAYCFSNVLTVLEVKPAGDILQFDSKKRWVSDELILGVQWVNQSQLAMVTATQQLILLNEKTMRVVSVIDLLSNHIYNKNLYSKYGNTAANFVSGFDQSFKCYKGKFFLVGKYEVYIGSSPNWVNILLDLVNQGRYIYAIETARQYYLGIVDNLESAGLPFSAKERQPLVLKYLSDIIRASATHVLTPEFVEAEGVDSIKAYLYTSVKALISIKAESVVLEELYEVFQKEARTDLFFDSIEPFILSGDLKTLTPAVLKDMVAYYISNGRSDTLEENICLLDIQSLDIDFTISLLKKNNLKDSYIYIWNKLLHDYITPFLEFIDDIEVGKEDCGKVYGYLAYILTGRQYPTEEQIAEPEAESAKLSLYYVLFNGLPVQFQNGKLTPDESSAEMTFPYIYQLIKYDSKSFLSAMNECLEDSLLNDDEIMHLENKLKVNRQFVIEVLVEAFAANDFSDLDRLNFAIFIARSYPKFQQFIRLPESLLDDTIKRLCSKQSDDDLREDCELSLQSLLSVYLPPNKNQLVQVFEKAEFYEILLNLYSNDRKYSEVLRTWIKFDKTNTVDTTDIVLQRCYTSSPKGSKERNKINEVVKENFSEIIEVDTLKIVRILNRYAPGVHKLALSLPDEQLKYNYLSSLVQLESEGLYKLGQNERNEYIIVLSRFDEASLLQYVKSLKPGDFDLNTLVDPLKTNGCVDTLVYLLSGDGKYEEALNEITSHMEKLIDKLPQIVSKSDKDALSNLESDIWKSLLSAIRLANHEFENGATSDQALTLNESLWLTLINFMVSQLKKFDRDGTSEKVINIIKRLLQDLFSTMINTRSRIGSFEIDESGISKHQSSFLRIFTEFLSSSSEFLSSSSVQITLLGDVRSVTNEIYLAFSYEKNILTITSKLINEGIYQKLQKASEKDLIGWSVKSFECDACGKTIWGRGLESSAYGEWENQQLNVESEEDSKRFRLVTFNCRHCYHQTCLENLGNSKGVYKCVICEK